MTECPRHAPERTAREGGYLLASVGVLLLVVSAMMASLSFVHTRQARFQAFYAMGQRAADVAAAAHARVQQDYYTAIQRDNVTRQWPLDFGGYALGRDVTAQVSPTGTQLGSSNGVTVSIIVQNSIAPFHNALIPLNPPVNPTSLAASSAAPSAYMVVRFAVGAQPMRPSDLLAFQTGATDAGAQRLGRVPVPPEAPLVGTCDGEPVRVQWGSDPSACLNGTHVTALGLPPLQPGDIVIPTWEVALGRSDQRAVFRYPQPDRPDLKIMTAALDMNNENILRTNDLSAQAVESAAMTVDNDMVVRNNADLNQVSAIQGRLTVKGNLNEAGPATFAVGSTINIAPNPDPLTPSLTGANLVVNFTNDAAIMAVDAVTTRTNGSSISVRGKDTGTATYVKAAQMLGSSGNVTVTDSGSTPGDIQTTGIVTANGGMDIAENAYARSVTTSGAGNTTYNGSLTTGSLETTTRNGIKGTVSVERFVAQKDCIGKACPDNVIDKPPDNPL